ncbi:hypothetical protein [Sorangium sp. So ce542]|uniref:hypothetical protein n=1 Tax=Sorangium sp. So ce542 TaxID=3133316 RepID=UPI003F5D95E2
MGLIDDLNSLDLGAVINARASITVAVESPQLRALVEGKGVVEVILGDLGEGLGELQNIAADPTALVKPIAGALEGIGPLLDTKDLPLSEYLEAVRAGVEIIAALLRMLGGDPSNLGKAFGFQLGDLLGRAGAALDSLIPTANADVVGGLRAMFASGDSVPVEPGAFAALAAEALIPLPRADLMKIRTEATALLGGARAIDLPPDRAHGLVVALDAVAAAPDAAALSRALAGLEQARAHAVESIAADVASVASRLGALRAGDALRRIGEVGAGLRSAQEGVLELFGVLRTTVAEARVQVEGIETQPIRDAIALIVAKIEEIVATAIIQPIEALAARAEAWARGLLAHLPLRELRSRLARFLHEVADKVGELGIDRFAGDIRAQLVRVQGAIGAADIPSKIRAALQQIEPVIRAALDAISAALDAIKVALDAIAGVAQPIAEKAVALLQQFRGIIDEIKASIEGLSIQGATEQVVDLVRQLRAKAEEMFQSVHLPDAAKPLVDQLVAELEGIDVGARILAPVKEQLAGFDVLEQLHVNEALGEARRVLGNLIPSDLGKTIEAEVGKALEVFQAFDVAKLQGALAGFLDEIAKKVEGFGTGMLVELLRAPFKLVLEALDQLHPRKLLAPVITAYDGALGGLTLPDNATLLRQLGTMLGGAAKAGGATATGGRVGGPAEESAGSAGGGAAAGDGGAGAPPAGGAGSALASAVELPDFASLRPGDFVRFLGYLPRKLREKLESLEAGAARELVRAVDALSGGLARDLRSVADELAAVERRLDDGLAGALAPLAEARGRTQLALEARFSAGGGVDLEGAIAAIALVGPGPMHDAIADRIGDSRLALRDAAEVGVGALGFELHRIADLLDSLALSRVGGDLDALLAALDPEPLAVEIDRLCLAMIRKLPQIVDEVGADAERLMDLLKGTLAHMNPAVQAQRLLRVFDVLREELAILSPATLADELAVVHEALVQAVSAYDPAAFAGEIGGMFAAIGASIRAVDPAQWLRPEDLAFLTETTDRVSGLIPTEALAGAGAALTEAGKTLEAIDIDGLLDDVEGMRDRIMGELERAIDEIAAEISALLASIKYAGSGGSASAEGSISIGGGG